jgi:hypothetical protein
MIKKLIITILIIPFLFVGLVQAQTDDLPDPGMLPDNPFYFLKSWSESIGTFLTFGEEKKAERFLELSERRLSEARALAEKERGDMAERAMEKYEEQLNKAMQRAEQAGERGMDIDALLERISERTLKHQEVLADVYERVPEEAREGIERAMENSMRGHEEALQAISETIREDARERMRTKREDVENKIEEIRGRGIDIPQIPKREETEEGTAPEIPVDIPTEAGVAEEREVLTPQAPEREEGEGVNDARPEIPETPGGRP